MRLEAGSTRRFAWHQMEYRRFRLDSSVVILTEVKIDRKKETQCDSSHRGKGPVEIV